ncbi:ABC transporter permease [Thermopolyspora flexuosa]|uniref:ATP-binding cassette subfamily B protein n=1 Tax=Thermopolyspora flexuosa TaxID=103836 RepID=A0A543IWY6_9ACTN|nr:ABC transporter ATP-binding protein [Thermopolyspora flexuosa]TQM75067.1 ATP-binding cassette subfamily B protein [Thermopolyspora flexuosa]GGM92427.1 ABC transporter permease [Thermopolyspora flexuosa]
MRRYLGLWAELFLLSLRRRPLLTAAALAVIVGNVVAMAVCAPALRATVDAMVAGEAPGAVTAAAVAAVAYAAYLVLQDVSGLLRSTVVDRIGRLDLHPKVYRDIAGLDGIEHLERSDFLDRVALVRASPGRIVAGLWNAIMAVANAAKLVVTLLLLGTVSPWLLPLLLFAAAPVWCDHRGQRVVRRVELETAEDLRLEQHLADLAVGAASGKEIRVAGAGPELVRRQAEAWQRATGRRVRAHAVAATWRFAGWLVFVTGFIGGLALVAYRTAQGEGTVGDLVLAVTVAATLRQTVQSTVTSTTETAGAARLLDSFLWLRDYAATQRAIASGTIEPPPTLRTGIVLESVSHTYPGTDRPALRDISATLPAGAVVAIVGEYGSGKTTLVKLLTKLYRQDSGRILVDCIDLNDLSTHGWRARTSAAFQDFGRFHTTFAETVGLGDLPHLTDRTRIERAVREADAQDLVAALPDGLDTRLGTELGGVDLSEGQWQRTALARASMRDNPLLFVLDEPTASLDAPSEQAIFERYMARARTLSRATGAVTVIVSHRFSTVTGADLILVLHRGRLVESGTHDELMALGGRYADLYTIQATAYAKETTL